MSFVALGIYNLFVKRNSSPSMFFRMEGKLKEITTLIFVLRWLSLSIKMNWGLGYEMRPVTAKPNEISVVVSAIVPVAVPLKSLTFPNWLFPQLVYPALHHYIEN